ncbi:MAG TPA: serine hydrolase domain-containing protein [Bacteroidales bacterium]|nr:serine hydrolase domain-containing protein [Bacteroidales bacterium]
MKTNFLILSFILLFSSITNGQRFISAHEDSLLNLLSERNQSMGSVAVLTDGNVLYAKSFGYRETSPEKLPSDIKTHYRIGSISKMFTTVLIMQMVEKGKISLATTLDKYYPSVPNSGKITIGEMLSHRSGIHSFTNDSLYMTYYQKPMTHDQMLDIISKNKPDFEPDTKADYSNTNFYLLGLIVEKLYGKPYGEVLKNQICSKIGLSQTYYGAKTDLNKNECYSFEYINDWVKQPETDMSIPHGAGSIVSTPSDLTKFIYALFNGKLISQQSLDQMTTIKDNFGLGMLQFPYDDKKVYGHTGGIDGFSSVLCYVPEDKVAFAVCSNGTRYKLNDILLSTVNNYYGVPDKLPEFTTYAVKAEDLVKYEGVYACPDIPIKVTIKSRDGKLFGQGTDQPEIPLESTEEDVFTFQQAGIVMRFQPDNNTFILEQGGGKFTFKKE